ncbi:MAG: DUF4398 domain-containing protein [Spirochaetaceae bacterium]|jgi:hypothetical protein|nr:DUF4398 domain-containing protein [Spirochaetaceae bacterium]
MKLNYPGLLPILAVILISIAGGCAKPPTREMEAAESAFARAENDPDAAVYAGHTLIRAREALSRMRSEAEAKRYDIAKSYAAEVVAASEKAISDGRAGALRASQEASTLVNTLKDSLGQTENALDNARQAEDLDLDFEGLGRELETARRDTEAAENAAAGNKPQEALEKGRNAQGALGDIMTELSDGVRTGSRKK